MKLVLSLLLLASCTSTAPDSNRWAIRMEGTDGTYRGGLVLEVTTTRTDKSCEGKDLTVARIVEKHGFDDWDPIGDEIAVRIDETGFFADLTPGICDGSLMLIGERRGNRASGEVSQSSLVGSMARGRFTAEMVRESDSKR